MTTTTTSGRLTVHTRVEDLPPLWDALAQTGGLSLCPRFLRALQDSAHETGNERYLVYETPSSGAVIAVGRILQPPSNRNPVVNVLLGRLYRRIPTAGNWLLPMLVLQGELTNDMPLVALAGAGCDRTALLRGMLQALEQEAIRGRWSLAVTGVPGTDVALKDALDQQGYLQTLGRPATELPVGYDSWEAFLKFATSQNKKAAANIRYETNRARRDGLVVREWDPDAVPEAVLYRLLEEHEQRLNRRGFRFRPAFLGTLKRELGARVRVLLAIREDQVEGVVVTAWTGSQGYVMFPGMIEKGERNGFAYFNLTYYRPIQLGIERGLKNLAYGNGAYEAKIHRGCRVVEQGLFFRPRRSLIRAGLRGPLALHRRVLERKFAHFVRARAFSSPR